ATFRSSLKMIRAWRRETVGWLTRSATSTPRPRSWAPGSRTMRSRLWPERWTSRMGRSPGRETNEASFAAGAAAAGAAGRPRGAGAGTAGGEGFGGEGGAGAGAVGGAGFGGAGGAGAGAGATA